MQPMVIDASRIAAAAAGLWWPVLRVGGFIAAAPIVSAGTVPARIRVVLTLAITFLLAPAASVPAGLSIFSGAGLVAAASELLVGVAIGLVVQLAFEAFSFGGQLVGMTMGLGFANLVDPVRGANTTVIGQFLMVLATLAYLSADGHLLLLGELANSFRALPIGRGAEDQGLLFAVVLRGATIFQAGLLIALPAVVALIIVNIALGVVTRAAPQLNLFGVGFPITLLAGYLVLFAGLGGIVEGMGGILREALEAVAAMTAAPIRVH